MSLIYFVRLFMSYEELEALAGLLRHYTRCGNVNSSDLRGSPQIQITSERMRYFFVCGHFFMALLGFVCLLFFGVKILEILKNYEKLLKFIPFKLLYLLILLTHP